jgi:hypothetical protein
VAYIQLGNSKENIPMKSKLLYSLRLAVPRLLLGLLGTGCSIGPIILLMSSAQLGLTAILFFLLLICYGTAFYLWSRRGSRALKEVITETKWAMCFIIIGLVISEITGLFTRIKLEMSIVYAFIGFFIAEFTKPRPPLKAIGEMLASLIRNRLPFGR